MVDSGDDARHRKLLFGEQAGDEVVLVIAGRGHQHIDFSETGPLEK